MTTPNIEEVIQTAIDNKTSVIDALEKAGFDLVEKSGWQDIFLEWRGFPCHFQAREDGQLVPVPKCYCHDCSGSGVKSYSSTATWRGGIGGQAFTSDVCDKCWGSGDDKKPWPSHKKFYAMNARRWGFGNLE